MHCRFESDHDSHVFGASSNGRTRDFGSLYLGSNPGAPTRIKLDSAEVGSSNGLENRSNRKVNCSMQSGSAIFKGVMVEWLITTDY